MGILNHDPEGVNDRRQDSPPPIDPDRAAEALKQAIVAHQSRDFAGHLAAKRQLIALGVGVVFQTPSGWEPTHV